VFTCPHLTVWQALVDLSEAGDSRQGDFAFSAYPSRLEAKANIIKNAEMIQRKHGKGARVKHYKKGDFVGVLVPSQDRKRSLNTTNFPGVIVEVLKSGYRVRCVLTLSSLIPLVLA
jgi:hypothetical protein